MKTQLGRRRLAAAISVRWTPALEMQVRHRVDERLGGRARRRRRTIFGLVTLVSVGAAGGVLALVAASHRRGQDEPARVKAVEVGAPQAVGRPMSLPTAPASAPITQTFPVPSPSRALLRTRGSAERRTSPPPDAVERLFSAADRARVGARPAEALRPLRDIVSGYAGDPRAPIAAFQLGRVLADDLGDHAAAALAFERALNLDPAGPVASEALARACEAHFLAGAHDRARTCVRAYLERYPQGTDARRLVRVVGLETETLP